MDDSQTPKAGTGTDNQLVILVRFTDRAPVGTTEADWAAQYFGAANSVGSYYKQASKNQFTLAPAAETFGTANNGVVGWLSLPYAHPNTGIDTTAKETYVADAIKAANPYVNFKSFDTNNNGSLDTDELHITVIGAGYETSYSGTTGTCGSSIWGHRWNLASAGVPVPNVDAVNVGGLGYTTFGEWHCRSTDNPGHKATIGIMAHEFGHDINWPDLYDTDGSSEGIGNWSLMAGGSWGRLAGQQAGTSPTLPDAWSRMYQGWASPQVVTATTNNISVPTGGIVQMSPNPGGIDWIFHQQIGTGQYFLVENRQLTGYDASLPGCGLVAYRINEGVEINKPNRDETNPLVKVLEADGDNALALGGNRGTAGDPYPGTSNNRDLNNTTNPNTKLNNGTATNVAMHVDSTTCGATMQIDVTPPAVVPVVRPANDNFAAAKVISGTSGNQSQTTTNATVEVGEPTSTTSMSASVWFRWTAPASGTLTLTTAGSSYDTGLGVYTGTAVNALMLRASNDDENLDAGILTSRLSMSVVAGTTYAIQVSGYNDATGNLTLAHSFAPTATPTITPTVIPTVVPTITPTVAPTITPTVAPTIAPTVVPTVVVDTTAPDTKIVRKPKKRTYKRKFRFRFTSTEAGSHFVCKIDKRRVKPCTSPLRGKVKAGRKHVLRVWAIDAAGNKDATPAKYRWKVKRR